jgi:glycosyltransferase involved in cell wall biosynthesis
MLRSTVVLIPARNPTEDLRAFIAELLRAGFAAVVVVDDGSDPSCRVVFDSLEGPGVHVLRHAVNLGKGRALKTGFNFVLDRLADSQSVVTADADGQHRVEDIVRVVEAMEVSPRGAVLGCRQFDGAIPVRSRLGNAMTRWIFRFITGRKISDTQTGLRGFPVALLAELMGLPGERYEYEMNVLGYLCRTGISLTEVPIATVYLDGNRSSHFDPIRDSMRIYFVLLRFYASSLLAAGIDFVGFSVTFVLTHDVLTSLIVGRLSSLANFLLNKRYVFHSDTPMGGSLWRYYVLAIGVAAISYGSIRGLSGYLGWNVFAAKLVVDSLLSFASFAVQRTFVFPERGEDS